MDNQEMFRRLLEYAHAFSNGKYTLYDNEGKSVEAVYDTDYESDNGLDIDFHKFIKEDGDKEAHTKTVRMHNREFKTEENTMNKLVSFYCNFFLYGSVTGRSDCGYGISVRRDNEGRPILSESGRKVNCETDEEFLLGIQEIILKNNLASINGLNKHTAGLPVMFQPCCFDAVYDSGERLHFSINNNPESEWGREIYKLTVKEFKKHGIDAFNPPADAGKITKFILTYTAGDMYYHFAEIEVPIAGVKKSIMELAEEGYKEGESEMKLQYLAWNRVTNERSTELGPVSDEYYDGLDKLISQIDLYDFANISGPPYSFNYKDTPDYYEYYIEYESGKVLRGFSDDLKKCEMFAPVAEKIVDYIKSHMS